VETASYNFEEHWADASAPFADKLRELENPAKFKDEQMLDNLLKQAGKPTVQAET